jgi:hypothetical protein
VNAAEVNHLSFHLRRPFREDNLLALLGEVRESSFLRTLTFHWPAGMGARQPDKPALGLSDHFLMTLLKNLPIARHLTHLASSLPLLPDHVERLRLTGVLLLVPSTPYWMHQPPRPNP